MTKIYTFHEDDITGVSCDQSSSAWLNLKLNKARRQEREAIRDDINKFIDKLVEIAKELP